jgi:methyl-accepting chemotaxis protein
MPEGDVKIRLVVDDGEGKKAAEGIKEELKDTSAHLEQAKGHGKGFGGELFKAELYTRLITHGASLVAEGLHQAWEMSEKLAESVMETSDEANKQVRAMGGLMSFMDQGAHSMDDLRGYAAGVREELEKSGTAAGVSTAQMEQMYESVIERGGHSTEQAKQLVEQMALVGKIVPSGMQGIAEGFNMMELGIVRARNPLVQLIASTHLLKGNAHDIAQQMMHMTPAKQMELAQEAIGLQAQQMKGGALGPPTLEEIKASLGNEREAVMEAIGQPLLDRVIPPLAKLRDYLSEHSEEIADYASQIGERMGEVIATVENSIGEIYSGAQRDWQAIVRNLKEAEQNWDDAWKMALGDSEDIHKELSDAAREFSEAIKTASEYLTAAVETVKNLKEFFTHELAGENGEATWGQGVARDRAKLAAEEMGKKAGAGGSQEDFEKSIAKYRGWAKEAGTADADIDKFVEAQRAYHEAEMRDLATFKDKVESSDVEGLAAQIQKARDVQDDAFLGAALNYIGESDAMTKALMDGTIHVQGGFDALKDVIERSAPELAERMKKLQREAFGPEGIKGHGPSVNFYGAQFHIKQDFRDADPDRILQMFRHDLVQQTVNRRQARTALFGGL